MKTRLKLNPGQKGAKALVDIYGDTLVCVRYRYGRTRIKTVGIIVEKTDWTPPSPKFSDDTLVPVGRWPLEPGKTGLVYCVWKSKRNRTGKAYSIRCQ